MELVTGPAEEALQASEERFRRIVETANEGIWLIDTEARTTFLNQRMADMLGCRVEEVAGRPVFEFVFDEDRSAAEDRIRQNFRGRQEQFDFRFRRRDGSAVHVLGGTSPVTNARGQVVGALGMFSDITDRRTTEQRLRVRHEVTLCLAKAATVSDGARCVLEAICQGLHWDLGILWKVDARAGTLGIVECWHAPEVAFPEFLRCSRATAFEAGVGLPGRVWACAEPAWIVDVAQDPNFPRLSAAVQEGLHGGFAFPILLGHATLGVVEFFSRQARAPDPDLLEMMTVVGSQIGQFLEHRRAEEAMRESEARFRQLAEAMPQIVWTANPEGWTEYINQQWCQYTGVPAEQANDPERLAEVTHPDERAVVHERWQQALAAGTPYECEFRLKRAADNAYRWFLSRAVPIKNEQGQVLRWFGTSTDIDDQKRIEESLKAADRRKDEFLAMLSHELRNPLAPVRNALHIMRMARLEDAALAEARDVVERQVRQLTVMIDDLLDIFRISRHRIALRKELLDLTKLVRQTVEDHRRPLEESGLAVHLHLPETAVWVTGDPTRLSQVLLNLLHNAAKFSNPGDSIFVRLHEEEDHHRAVVSVRDTGIGIPAEILPHVFDSFTQAEQTLDRHHGGLGLGLALVKGIIDLHGGEVRAQSLGPSHGAEFTFWLPLERRGNSNRERGPHAVRSARQLRILVVEDNRDAAKTLAALLRRYGHEVTTAYSGTTGVQAARQWPPDLVLCDLGLPEMDGYEVARALRQDPVTATARLIAVSGYGYEEDRQRSEAAGFDLHLTKPVDPSDLQRLLADLNRSPPHGTESRRVVAQENV